MKKLQKSNLIFRAVTLLLTLTLAAQEMQPIVAEASASRAAQLQGFARPEDTPKWDVLSVKQCEENRISGSALRRSPGRMHLSCSTVKVFIQMAYDLFSEGHPLKAAILPNSRTIPIVGGPDWVNSDMYEIIATVDGNPSQEIMWGPMLQILLEERFKLQIHREIREVPVYALTTTKNPSKLQPFREGSCNLINPGAPAPTVSRAQVRPCGGTVFSTRGTLRILDLFAVTLTTFAQTLTWNLVDRPVIDRTGISDLLNIHLEFAPDEGAPIGFVNNGASQIGNAEIGAAPAGPSIFSAIQEQLGLRLEPTKGPGTFLVIDNIARPTEN